MIVVGVVGGCWYASQWSWYCRCRSTRRGIYSRGNNSSRILQGLVVLPLLVTVYACRRCGYVWRRGRVTTLVGSLTKAAVARISACLSESAMTGTCTPRRFVVAGRRASFSRPVDHLLEATYFYMCPESAVTSLGGTCSSRRWIWRFGRSCIRGSSSII